MVEVQCEGLEQFGETPLDGIMDIITMFIEYKFSIHEFVHRHLAQIRASKFTDEVRATDVKMGMGVETKVSFTHVETKGGESQQAGATASLTKGCKGRFSLAASGVIHRFHIGTVL